jgi:hypothetical protein
MLYGTRFIADQLGVNPAVIYGLYNRHQKVKRAASTIHGAIRFMWPQTREMFVRLISQSPRGDAAQRSEEHLDMMDGKVTSSLGENEGKVTFAECRREREYWGTLTAKLKYEQGRGVLVDIDEVQRNWTTISLSLQKALLTVPDRLAPLCVGEPDPAIIRKRILDEIEYALRTLDQQAATGGPPIPADRPAGGIVRSPASRSRQPTPLPANKKGGARCQRPRTGK